MKTYSAVVSAEALPDFRVQVVFDTGEHGVFDCKPLLSDPFSLQIKHFSAPLPISVPNH